MPKGLPWFRLYAEFAFDPKIQTISETLQRRYIMLLCLKCHGEIPGLNDIQLSGALRISVDELHKTHDDLLSVGIISDNYDIPKWSERQYRSDSSTSRVAKFRSKKGETLQKRKCNGSVTPLSVSVSKYVSESFNIFYKEYPRKIGKHNALKVFTKINPDKELLDKIMLALKEQKKNWRDIKFTPHPATWLNGKRWEDEIPATEFKVGMNQPDKEWDEAEYTKNEIKQAKAQLELYKQQRSDRELTELEKHTISIMEKNIGEAEK